MGALQDYLQEARRLKLVDAQPEVITFMGTVYQRSGGEVVIGTQSPSVRVAPGYMFVCDQIKASCPTPPTVYPDDSGVPGNREWTMGEFLPYISFNVLNEGLTKSIFKTPVPLSALINALGSTEGLQFKVPISFFEGADINITWFVDVESLGQYFDGGLPFLEKRRFNPQASPIVDSGNNDLDTRVEFYIHLIGTIIRATTVL